MKLALITGASKGIGRSTAKVFANAGWNLILVGRDLDSMEQLKLDLSSTGRNILIVECDLLDSENIKIEIPKILKNVGCPSVLINNAGFAINRDLMDTTIDEWQKIIQVNLTSVFQICNLIVPSMRQEGGIVINVSSHAANNAFPQWGAYCVSKAALASFTKCLREEERSNSIRACTITLGSVNTPLWDSKYVTADFDKKSMLSADKVAQSILYIAEQDSSQIIEDLTLMPSGGAF